MWEIKPTYVTFIIPSMGRESLNRAVQSLLELEDWDWRAIIVFDGVEPIKIPCIDYENDNHFIVLKTERLYHAGLVRNLALPIVDTRWTAFLDDDDFLTATYIGKLREFESRFPDRDIIIFTYKDIENGNTQPPAYLDHIVECSVGISFAIKTDFVQRNNIQFTKNGVEDFRFLRDCVSKGATYIITHSTQYFVGHRSAWGTN